MELVWENMYSIDYDGGKVEMHLLRRDVRRVVIVVVVVVVDDDVLLLSESFFLLFFIIIFFFPYFLSSHFLFLTRIHHGEMKPSHNSVLMFYRN